MEVRLVPCLILALLASCLAAVPAAAAPPAHDRPYLMPVFEVPATNGYRVEVFGIHGRRDEPARVGVIAWDSTSVTTYVARGRMSRGHMRASLGRFGRVDVHFRRRGARWVRSLCGGKPNLFVTGIYEGAVEFEAEEGFTQAISPDLEAEPLYQPASACNGVDIGHGGEPGAYLKVYSRYATTVVVQNAPGGTVRYDAFASNRTGGIEIGRLVEVSGPSEGFHWSSNLKRATVAPPAPFSGTASYRALGGRVTHWEGSLKVDFPGFADYPLTPGPSLTEFIHGSCHTYSPSSVDLHPPLGCM